jgi:NAD+ synthase
VGINYNTTGIFMTPYNRAKFISKWIKDYAKKNKIHALVVGVSGGIDSAVVSTLCAETGLPVTAVTLPIRQNKKLHNLSLEQIDFLTDNYDNVVHVNIDLTTVFSAFEKKTAPLAYDSKLAFANSRSRLRMITLYQIAQSIGGIVVGTGNKVEDFGVGFFTKYGDGGVDISPIGDCMKTDVWAMGEALHIPKSIIEAPPTDGLWDDGRTDEDQLGMSYADLEVTMKLHESGVTPSSKEEKAKLKKYMEIRARNLHKMNPIPVCVIPKI